MQTPAASDAAPAGGSPQGASAAQRTIAVVGDVWTLRILRTVFRGVGSPGTELEFAL